MPSEACIGGKCQNPCVGTCGQNALCQVLHNSPICSCPSGFMGDPFIKCYVQEPVEVTNPCDPSPCGPQSECQIVQNRAVCSCSKNMIGKPPYCRKECVLNSECPQNKACINEKCADPCSGSCGSNTNCQTVNHVRNFIFIVRRIKNYFLLNLAFNLHLQARLSRRCFYWMH